MNEHRYEYEMRCDFREAREHEFWVEALADIQNRKTEQTEQTEQTESKKNNDTQR